MLNKRLMGVVPGCKKYIAQNVVLQWCALAANIAMIFMQGLFLQALLRGGAQGGVFWGMAAVMAAAALVRFLCTKGAARAAFYASKEVKKALRGLIYRKLLRLGAAYTQNVPTAEVVQLAGEGTEQLETYFGAYLPQLFYSMLAPVTLFAALCTVSVRAAVVLMVCVPLIPFSIMAVQKFAKRLLGKYWGQYAALGDHFLENLQGLTTLKIYGADEDRHRQMNRDAEHFRHKEHTVSHTGHTYRYQSYMQAVGRLCDFAQYHKAYKGYQHGAGGGYALAFYFKDFAEHYQRADAYKSRQTGRRRRLEHIAQECPLDLVFVWFKGYHKGRHSYGKHAYQCYL